MPARSEVSATNAGSSAGVDETLQSKLTFVDPALTPAIKVATTAPVPAVIFTVQGALAV
jgi:hypothetical protein